MAEPLDVKFGPTISKLYHKDNHTVTITIESNPKPSWNLTAMHVCHGENSTCSEIKLSIENNTSDHLTVEMKPVSSRKMIINDFVFLLLLNIYLGCKFQFKI